MFYCALLLNHKTKMQAAEKSRWINVVFYSTLRPLGSAPIFTFPRLQPLLLVPVHLLLRGNALAVRSKLLARETTISSNHCFLVAVHLAPKAPSIMTSIPLHCSICPKRPDFSDISHLLTHVGSKGHLAHYFKAQVRSREDGAVHRQLEAYDDWYEQHGIEKLLSKRMVLKDSKRANGVTAKQLRTNKTKTLATKPCKRPNKTSSAASTQNEQDGSCSTDLIDPQLKQENHTVGASFQAEQAAPRPPSSSGFDLATMNRNFVPRMRSFMLSSPSRAPALTLPNQGDVIRTFESDDISIKPTDSSTDNEHDIPLGNSPVESVYPDLPATQRLFPASQDRSTASPLKYFFPASRCQYDHLWDDDDKEDFFSHSPELKGTCYPGMSIFDSASPGAQRKRNQRKKASIVEQIERESLQVEQLEQIYWPDGSLKMRRFITGEVQSSPLKEDPPLPPKRRGRKSFGGYPKNKKTRTARPSEPLDGLKDFPSSHNTNPVSLQDISRKSLAMLDNSLDYDSLSNSRNTNNEDSGWLLDRGKQELGRQRPFSVYNDSRAAEKRLDTNQASQGISHGDPLVQDSHSVAENSHSRHQHCSDSSQQQIAPQIHQSTGIFGCLRPGPLSGQWPKSVAQISDLPAGKAVVDVVNPVAEHTVKTKTQVSTQPALQSYRPVHVDFCTRHLVGSTSHSELPLSHSYGTTLNPLNPNTYLCRSTNYDNQPPSMQRIQAYHTPIEGPAPLRTPYSLTTSNLNMHLYHTSSPT